MIIHDSRLDEVITLTKKPSRLGVVVKIANEVSKKYITSRKSTQLCGLTGVRLQLAVPPVQYEKRIVEACFCGGFVAQWFMVALVRHPGSESCSFRYSLFSLLSQQAGFHLTFVFVICLLIYIYDHL